MWGSKLYLLNQVEIIIACDVFFKVKGDLSIEKLSAKYATTSTELFVKGNLKGKMTGT